MLYSIPNIFNVQYLTLLLFSYVTSVEPCDIKWDLIMKLETLSKDLQVFTNLTGLHLKKQPPTYDAVSRVNQQLFNSLLLKLLQV